MSEVARQHRLYKRHLQQQLTEWSDLKASGALQTHDELQARLDLLIEMQHEQKQLDDKLLNETDEEHYDAVGDELFKMKIMTRRAITEITCECNKLITPEMTIQPLQNEPRISNSPTREGLVAKLPQIELPKFDGNYSDWLPFNDQFVSSVDNNPKLSKVQKLIYLKRCLSGPAERLIRNLETTEDNYDCAMKILDERYHNERVIVRQMLTRVVDFRPVRTENAFQLRLLHNTFHEAALAFKAMKLEVENHMWYHLLFSKMDPETQKAWELRNPGTNCLQYDDIMKFLDTRTRSMETCNPREGQHRVKETKQLFATEPNRPIQTCPVIECKAKHSIWKCPVFLSQSPTERKETVMKGKLCFNCLRSGHTLAKCSSESRCKTCQSKHHSFLHESRHQSETHATLATEADLENNMISILPTAEVEVLDSKGKKVKLRALLDTCAHISAITASACKKLGIKIAKSTDRIIGVNQTCSSPVEGNATISVKPKIGGIFNVKCVVLHHITRNKNPKSEINQKDIQLAKNYDLADPNFNIPGQVDLLLGVAVYSHILRENAVKLGTIALIETALGWTVSGMVRTNDSDSDRDPFSINFIENDRENFENFWKIEDVPSFPEAKFTPEEISCEKHYKQTTTYSTDGRVVVRLPIRESQQTVASDGSDLVPDIGHSAKNALRQFIRNENKLKTNEIARQQYAAFFQEMIDTGHIEKVPLDQQYLEPGRYFVMPHHAVWKESTTTKCRAVFNASAETSNGKSLNDCIMIGPKQQPELIEILIRLRFYPVVLSGDVTKMYRQLILNESDRNLHQLYWRSSPNEPIERWRLTRVIYGVASSSYHAIRALRESVNQAPNQTCKDAILNSFYVDDFLGGASTPDQAVKLYQDISATLATRGMKICKWASNSEQVMQEIPCELHENQDFSLFKDDISIKALGLNWTPQDDTFFFQHKAKLGQTQPSTLPEHNKTAKTAKSGENTEKTDIKKLVKNDFIAKFGGNFNQVKNVPQDHKPVQNNLNSCPIQKKPRNPIKFENTKFSENRKSGSDVKISTNFNQVKVNSGAQKQPESNLNDCPMQFRLIKGSENDLDFNEKQPKTGPDCQLWPKFSITKQNASTKREVPTSSTPVPVTKAPKITRRIISSNLGKVFDPLGLVTPVTILPKIIFQKTWESDLNWDDDVGEALTSQFLAWLSSLVGLSKLRIPRLVTTLMVPNANFKPKNLKLHLFVDASEKAYGAAIYAPSPWTTDQSGGLLIAKSRLAPKRSISLPRLELCAMVLGVNLMQYVLESLKPLDLQVETLAWSDSTIALAWIKSTASRFQAFIANRVAKIQRAFPVDIWKYVPTSENPADHCTRPVAADDLPNLNLWWNGPTWIHNEPLNIPEQPQILENTEFQKELRKKEILTLDHSGTLGLHAGGTPTAYAYNNTENKCTKDDNVIPLERWGNIEKAIRITKLIVKFIHKLHKSHVEEGKCRQQALNHLIRQVQHFHYSQEISCLESKQPIAKDSKIIHLYPFLDENNILKVGGRLLAADCLTQDTRFPIIIPGNSHLAKLITLDSHQKLAHCGTNATIAHTRKFFWITRIRTLARKTIENCVKCNRFNCRNMHQLMGDLPSERVNPSPPFSHVGIDFAGPFIYQQNNTRFKCYLVVFICFATKAVHLDVAKSLDTQECMKVIRRFIARRGCPKKIFSDNGTNFIGSLGDLMKLKKLVQEKYNCDSLPQSVLDLGINWGTIPARASHFGGLWESAVKSMKLHFHKIVGKVNNLQLDEIYTILCHIEAIMNSRPITRISDDTLDNCPLTPSMLLTGFKNDYLPIVAPTIALKSDETCPIKRFKYLQTMIKQFWNRWSSEYLTEMQVRQKNQRESNNLQKGDLVYITDANTPPLYWPIGVVVETYSGNDDLIRVVKVKTGKEKFTVRPIVKLKKINLI